MPPSLELQNILFCDAIAAIKSCLLFQHPWPSWAVSSNDTKILVEKSLLLARLHGPLFWCWAKSPEMVEENGARWGRVFNCTESCTYGGTSLLPLLCAPLLWSFNTHSVTPDPSLPPCLLLPSDHFYPALIFIQDWLMSAPPWAGIQVLAKLQRALQDDQGSFLSRGKPKSSRRVS